MNTILKSVFDNEQDLLRAILTLHVKTETFDCDPMYFKGNFYRTIPAPRLRFDINPQVEGVAQGDATNLPIPDDSLDSIILDPPFMFGGHGKQDKYYSSMTHGILTWNELQKLYQGILKDAHRTLKKWGTCVFKCQDYTDSKSTMTHCLVWLWAQEAGFYPKDLAILNLPKNKVANPNLTQRHLRKVHSYFWVFKKL